MTPILGIWASSTTSSKQNSYESIATGITTAGGFIDFNSIPQTYTHLQIRINGASAYSPGSGNLDCWVGLNNQTTAPTAGYTHRLYGDGTNASASSSSQTDLLNTGWLPFGFGASYTGALIIDILDYANTNKFKTIRSLGGYDANGSGYISLVSGYSNITAAVSQIRVATNSGGYTAGTSIALYGIKG